MAGEIIDSAHLLALLPHRFPFLLVDRIRVLEAGRRVLGTKRIAGGEWWCGGDATAQFPFSLVIEALAQTTAALLRDLMDDAPGGVAYFMGADRVRLRRPARPGDELALAVTLQRWRRGICRTRAVATVDGDLVASAILTIALRPAG